MKVYDSEGWFVELYHKSNGKLYTSMTPFEEDTMVFENEFEAQEIADELGGATIEQTAEKEKH